MAKILVTGAAGFVGSHLAERLADLNHEVAGLDCFTAYYSPAQKRLNARDLEYKKIPVYELDLAVDDLSEPLDGIEIIYHLAGQPGISASTSFEEYVRNNVMATHRLLEACKQLPSLQCLVNVSTSSVYGKYATDSEDASPKPTSYYGVTKLAAEQLALAYQREQQLPVCSLRLFSVYGPRERPDKLYPRLIRSILNDVPFPLHEGSREHSRSFTFVNDAVDGFLAVLNHLDNVVGEIINVGSNIERTTDEAIKIVEKIMGKEAQMVMKPRRPGDQLRTNANINKARNLLNYNPSTLLEDGLAAEIEWYVNHASHLTFDN